ncbi:MAG: carbon storage regulator [Planctomycetales bacterium]|nr:carbon storage regulator [Planctomycetales bacterium]
MLVLSRKLGEEIVLPGLGVSIKLLDVRGNRVRLGITAPQSVSVVRREIVGSSVAVAFPSEVSIKELVNDCSSSSSGRTAFVCKK